MYQPTHPYRKFFIAMAILAAAGTGCGKDKEEENSSASREIMKSETLVIPAAVDVPANLPGGNSRVATYFAEGVQQYKARIKPGSSPAAYEWIFVAPQANLYDITGKKVGTHSAGPTWQLSAADSIYAQHFSPVKSAPAPVVNSIDWLLLMPKTGKTPTGFFREVDYIQRIATAGGKAPATAPVNESATVEVPYTAVYRFTKKK
jgi:hypothetical protein